MADSLWGGRAAILAANGEDMAAARGSISEVMLDRLALTEERVAAMAEGVRQVAALPDPVGRVLRTVERPNGLTIRKLSVPMGVVAIIYESRPNVTSDAAALALKSGNVCVLRGGKEAFRSAHAIVEALREGLAEAGLPREAVSLVQDTTRQSARELGLTLREGVYCYFPGPQFETPAEVRAARVLGGDACGMSTAPEAIAAAHAGMEVLGFSMLTNMCAGILDQPLSGEEVNETAEARKGPFSELVLKCLEKM